MSQKTQIADGSISTNNIVVDFIHSFITAPSPTHAYRHMQLFKVLFPAFLEHCGPHKDTVSDADWSALFEFLLMVAEQPVTDEEEEKAGNFKGTLMTLRCRRMSAMDAMSCLSDAITKPHRSRCRVYTILQGKVAERIANALDFQHHQFAKHAGGNDEGRTKTATSSAGKITSAAAAMMGSIRSQIEAGDDAFDEIKHDDDDDEDAVKFHPLISSSSSPSSGFTPAVVRQKSVTINTADDGEDGVFGDHISLSTLSHPISDERDEQIQPPASSSSKPPSFRNQANPSSSTTSLTHHLQSSTTTTTSLPKERGDQTLAEVTNCEALAEEMALAASSAHSIPPVTTGASSGSSTLDLWFFTLDAVPAKMLGSLTETEYVAIETWFNGLPREVASAGANSFSSASDNIQQQHSDNSHSSSSSSSLSATFIRAHVTEGLLKGISGQSQPLTVGNVKTLAPRVFEVSGLWKFDCRLLDEWINTFPRGTGTLADVLSFFYRDTPRMFIMRRIEGQCLAVPSNQSDAWPADAFCCGELVVPLQNFPPTSSPPALRLSHISMTVSSNTNNSSSNQKDSIMMSLQPDSNNHPFGGSAGVYKAPDAHIACLSVITFLRIGVTSSNRKEFLIALKAWFDSIDFANLGYITLFGLQVTMMRFREPHTSPVLVEKRSHINNNNNNQSAEFWKNQQESLANQFSGFNVFSDGTTSNDNHQNPTLGPSGENQNVVAADGNGENEEEEVEIFYEKNPFLEKAPFHECVEKAHELSKRFTTNNNKNNSNTTSSSSSNNNNAFFLSNLETLCDIDVREIFQYAVCNVVQRLQSESFAAAAASATSPSPSSSSSPSRLRNSHHHHSNATDEDNKNEEQLKDREKALDNLTVIAASLQVLSGENLHVFKPPPGAIITANKRSALLMHASTSSHFSAASNSQFAFALQQALNATEIFVSQNPELHRPVTFELFARAIVEVAGLSTSSSTSTAAATTSSTSTIATNIINNSNTNNSNLQIIHPAVLAEVANISILRTMRRRNYKHAADDKFNSLVAKYLSLVALNQGAGAGGVGGRGGLKSATKGGGAISSSSVSRSGAVTTPQQKKGGKDANSGMSSSSSFSHQSSLFANGPVSFTISADHRQRLRKRVDACLHSFEGIGFLLVVTNVRAHFRIQKRLQQLAALDEEQQRRQNVPLGKQRRNSLLNAGSNPSSPPPTNHGASTMRRKSSASGSLMALCRRRASASSVSSGTFGSHHHHQDSSSSSSFFDEDENPLMRHLSTEEKDALRLLASEAMFFSNQQTLFSASTSHQPSSSVRNPLQVAMMKKNLASFMMQRLKPIPLMKLDRLFDPTNTTDTMLLHLDASGLLIDYFVKEPKSTYRRLPSHLLSSKARFFRDIGYWSSSKRRVTLRSKYYFANSQVEKVRKNQEQQYHQHRQESSLLSAFMEQEDQNIKHEPVVTSVHQREDEDDSTIGEYILMRTNIPAGCDVAYRFHFEGYNGDNGESINTIVCGREGRKGNALVSGEDHVTCDVDDDRTPSITVRSLSNGIDKVTAVLVNRGGGGEKAKKFLALKIFSPTNSWSVGGFSVSLGVVSELYGAGFLCGVSFEVVGVREPWASESILVSASTERGDIWRTRRAAPKLKTRVFADVADI